MQQQLLRHAYTISIFFYHAVTQTAHLPGLLGQLHAHVAGPLRQMFCGHALESCTCLADNELDNVIVCIIINVTCPQLPRKYLAAITVLVN